jgi:hypothetical protein
MKPLDPGQERELAYVTAHRGSWTTLSWPRRLLVALASSAVVGVAMCGFAAGAGGRWVLVGLAAFGGMFLLLLIPVIAPERFMRASIRATFPTADAMGRGNSNKYWPG